MPVSKTVRINLRHSNSGLCICSSQRIGRCRRPCDGNTISQPEEGRSTNTVLVSHSRPGGQGLTNAGYPRDCHAARRRIVHVAHCAGRGAGHSLSRALTVGIARPHADRRTNLRLTKRQRRTGRAIDSDTVAEPLVGHLSHAIGVRQSRICRQGRVFCHRAGDRHRTCRGSIDMCYDRRAQTVEVGGSKITCIGVVEAGHRHRPIKASSHEQCIGTVLHKIQQSSIKRWCFAVPTTVIEIPNVANVENIAVSSCSEVRYDNRFHP